MSLIIWTITVLAAYILNIVFGDLKTVLTINKHSFFKLILILLTDPYSLIFQGKPFHSFAMRYWKNFCPIALVKGGRFIWSDCLVLQTDSLVVNRELTHAGSLYTRRNLTSCCLTGYWVNMLVASLLTSCRTFVVLSSNCSKLVIIQLVGLHTCSKEQFVQGTNWNNLYQAISCLLEQLTCWQVNVVVKLQQVCLQARIAGLWIQICVPSLRRGCNGMYC